MQAVTLLQKLAAAAGWSPEPLSSSEFAGAQALLRVDLDDYTLYFAVYSEDLLYACVQLQQLPADPELSFELQLTAAKVTAHLWQDHPFYLCSEDGGLRAQLYLPSDLDADAAADRLAVFLDDVDYLSAQLQARQEPQRPAMFWGGF